MKIKEGGVMDIQKNRKEHMLKTDPAVFQDVLDGSKTFEIRFNDRGYQVGDLIVLKETKFTGQQMKSGQPLVYTGREIQKRISYVLGGYGLQDDWVILGIQDIEAAKAQAVPEGFVLIKDDTKTVVAIERMVEQQVEASGMDSRRLERLDGWKIIEAAVKAQEPAND